MVDGKQDPKNELNQIKEDIQRLQQADAVSAAAIAKHLRNRDHKAANIESEKRRKIQGALNQFKNKRDKLEEMEGKGE